MKNDNISSKSLSGVIWKLMEKCGSQIVSFVVQIVLARLLLPETYGIIGYLTLFISLSDVFLKQGFTTALIQKKDADELDFSSVFWANIILAIVIYALFYVLAPAIAAFYEEEQLTQIMRVLSLNVVIGSLSAVQEAVMAKHLDFKKSFYRGLSNTITYGIVGIILAYLGFGVWSLVYARLAGVAVGAIVMWLTVDWRPVFLFSAKRIGNLFRFSSKVLANNLMNTLFNNINSLIIGKFYTSTDLGHYNRGRNIPQTIMDAIDGSLAEVMYPTFSAMQGNLETMKYGLRKSMKLSMYIVLPVMAGLVATAEPLTVVLLTDKWLPSVPYMQLTCVICMFWPLSARFHALNALGNSGLTLRLSMVSKVLSLLLLLIMAQYGVIMIMWGSVITSVICLFINNYFVEKHLNYTPWELLQDIGPSALLTAVMGVVVYGMTFVDMDQLLLLVIQVVCGITIYVIGSIVFRIDCFWILFGLIKDGASKLWIRRRKK